MEFNRRRFLKAVSATATGLAFPAIVKANPAWAVLPSSVGELPKYKVLEIFMPGGASQWENFWVSHDGPIQNGMAQLGGNPNWRGLEQYVSELIWQSCANAPASSTQTNAFGEDANGTNVSWGPATAPLWRQDIFNRCRMLVTQHSDELHAFAGHRALTGRRFGSSRSAGLGAAIQRHFQSLGQQQDIPYSYTLAPKHLGRSYFLNYATSLGQHPGPARPLGLKVGDAIGTLLQRPGVSNQADAVFSELRDQYRDLLRWQGAGDPIRSADFASYDSASDYLVNAGQLDTHLGGNALVADTAFPCSSDPAHDYADPKSNPTKRSLELAAYMLNNGARHITVIDGGLPYGQLRDSSTPYDGHHRTTKNVVEMTSAHLFNLAQSIADIVDSSSIALPVGYQNAEQTPKINLDDTLIVIHTEFNRRPTAGKATQPDGYKSCGREHFPNATAAVLIGGPVTSRGIHGGIAKTASDEYESAVAIDALTPTDVHAGALLASGVDPLNVDNFTSGDEFSEQINPGGSVYDEEIRLRIKQKVLGISGSQINSIKFG